jgi:hypothetical protein
MEFRNNDSDSDGDDRSETMSWIDDEELEDEFYGAFYNAPIESVQVVQMLFSHDCQKCVSVSRASYQLETPGVITPEEMIPMIKCQTANGFHPFSVLRFAIELDASNLNAFVDSPSSPPNDKAKVDELTYTDSIKFPDSVKALEPTASLFILYKKKQPKASSPNRRKTRVIRIKDASYLKQDQTQTQSQSTGKRPSKKTRRKAVSFGD